MENFNTLVNDGGYDQMSFDTNLVNDQNNLEHMNSPVRDDIDEIPNDRDSHKIIEDPYVGMSFESIKDVEKLYYTFAGQKGFTVCKWSTKHSKQGLRKKTYVCSKHGKSRAKIPVDNLAEKKTKPRHIRNPRTECKALYIVNQNFR
ncbi:hypothetical protein ZOSMA_28G00660 [Zostera marina]|uniref:FAR1 domain-containing protein n=1 Tax=Zostera marina TaxID=29655 RepID=A0A0K9PCM4_ZOSMR|nr:hypothetical protein ZOSMA_28G00660 [Zostera marina]